MARRKIQLSEEQKKKNAQILARLEADKKRLFEETRALQQQFRRRIRRKRRQKQASPEGILVEE